MNIIDAIQQRHAVRAYLDKPVDKELIERILEAARWAPSGVNTQPWKVMVISGQTQSELAEKLIKARIEGVKENPDYAYYPEKWTEPYLSRRQRTGMALYRALGISVRDKQQRMDAWIRNYRFFDAPVGLIFCLDEGMQTGSWLDLGMFMQNIMLAAQEVGLATCPQASLAEYPDVVRQQLELPDDSLVICGMALGYADPDVAVNQYRLSREEVTSFTHWYE